MKIEDIEIFENLSNKEINQISKIIEIKHKTKDDILFLEGDKPEYLHILLSGIAKVYKIDKKGNELVMHYFNPQSMIAELANLENMNFPANCRMEEDGIIAKIKFDEFKNIVEANGKLAVKLIKSLTKKMKFLDSVIQQNLLLDTKGKVTKFIYENEDLFTSLKQHKIASILNITPETLSRTLKKLKDLNILENDKNRFIIINREKLKEFF
jgi:CRP/FNR family transcriptional regulator